MHELINRLDGQIAEKRAKIDGMVAKADREKRDLTLDEQTAFNALVDEVKGLKSRVETLEAAEDAVTEVEPRSRGILTKPPGPAPTRHDTGHGFNVRTGERRGYSYFRAITRAAEVGYANLDGIEGEVSREIARRCGKAPEGFYLPLGGNPEIRDMMYPGMEHRDLTTTTGAGTIFNRPESELIDLLRGKLVVRELGATVMTGMRGVFSIPRQTGTASFSWLGEGASVTPTTQTFDQVGFVPHFGLAATGLTRLLLNQSSLDAEQMVKDDLAALIARELDKAAISGPGGVAPTGILNRTGIVARSAGLALGANGGPIGWNNVVAMESLITTSNADQGKCAYLTTPAMRGKLKSVAKVVAGATATGSITLWENGDGPGVGDVNGYPAYTSTLVPSNITKGTGTNLSAIIFAYWKDLVVALWEGADVLCNPYSPQLSGGVVISLGMSADVQVKHDESFAVILDGSTA